MIIMGWDNNKYGSPPNHNNDYLAHHPIIVTKNSSTYSIITVQTTDGWSYT
jgi:hypothetical protein